MVINKILANTVYYIRIIIGLKKKKSALGRFCFPHRELEMSINLGHFPKGCILYMVIYEPY